MEYTKIFVGNIPFKCEEDDFIKCFEKMDGFIKAEIIFKSDTKISRGFGFVTFNNNENAHKLLLSNNIIYKDRLLRFSEYETKKIKNKESNNDDFIKLKTGNFIMVKSQNIFTKNDLYNAFNQFGYIGRHFIASDRKTGKLENYGIVEILNDELYEEILNKKELIYNDNIFELIVWNLC